MSFSEFIASLSGVDLIDIAAVAIVVYGLLLLIRGTRAVQVILGILVLVAIAYMARLFGLVTLDNVLQNFVLILPFAIIVMFQDQIRRALATFGDTSSPRQPLPPACCKAPPAQKAPRYSLTAPAKWG